MTRFLVLAAAAMLAAGGALAHHGWGSYDAAKPFTIRGQVETLRWHNPHVHVDVKHQGATWEAVLAPPFRMEGGGGDGTAVGRGGREGSKGVGP